MPKLWYLYNDCVWHILGEKLDCLFYLPNIITTHEHFLKDPRFADDISDVTNSKETYQHDLIEYSLWSTRQVDDDVEKIRGGLDRFGLCPKKAG